MSDAGLLLYLAAPLFVGGLIALTDDKPHGWRCYLGRHTAAGKPRPGCVGMIWCKRCRRTLAFYDWSNR